MSTILDMIEMDETAKQVFMAMSREDQLFAILGMVSFLRNELAVVKKGQISTQAEVKKLRDDQNHYRQVRERREKLLQDQINGIFNRANTMPMPGRIEDADEEDTTEKVAAEVAKIFASRFDFWIWFRDKVLPTIILTIILGLLYLVFGNP
jgi:septation ring formation regulator EzrA